MDVHVGTMNFHDANEPIYSSALTTLFYFLRTPVLLIMCEENKCVLVWLIIVDFLPKGKNYQIYSLKIFLFNEIIISHFEARKHT